MNTDKLARTTFVLLRETSEDLDYVSRRMGVSRSVLVRDVLKEPVSLMASWLRRLPEDRPLTADDAVRFGDALQLDLVEFIERNSALSIDRGDKAA